jgi:hypothetical protein
MCIQPSVMCRLVGSTSFVLVRVSWTLESDGGKKMKTLHAIAEHEHFPKSAPCRLTPYTWMDYPTTYITFTLTTTKPQLSNPRTTAHQQSKIKTPEIKF